MKIRIIALALFIFTARVGFATTYYVAASGGSDSNSCSTAQSISTPKLTLNGGVNCMSAGDTLEVRAGTYNESLDSNTIPAGISSGSRTTIKKHAGDATPTLVGSVWISTHDNINWDGININGVNNAANSGEESSTNFYINGGSNIHITNSEIYNCQHHCVLVYSGNGSVSSILLDYLVVHTSGIGASAAFPLHNFYLSGSGSFPISSVTVDHIESYGATCPGSGSRGFPNCWGLQMYSANSGEISSVTVSNSYFHDNNQGIVVGSGANHKIYNNVLYNNALIGSYCEAAITVGYGGGADNIQVDNNTIVGNSCGGGAYGISVGTFGAPTNTLIKNNILYQNGHDSINQAGGTGTVTTTNFLATDPLFVNQAAQDFHLKSSSTAIGAGTNLFSVFTVDKDGNTRSSSGSWEAGAYAFVNTVSPPPAPQNLHLLP